MKQALIILALLAATVWGHLYVAGFDNYLIMIGLISFLVIAHEFGHFFVARKVGVKVERFGFGLPIGPTLLEKEIKGTKFCLHPVLLGGYVSFPDDNPDSEIPKDSPLRFENKSIADRAAIAVAGVVVNFILGYLIMVFVFATWGAPGDYYQSVDKVLSPTSPAAVAGLQSGDLLLAVDKQPLLAPEMLNDYLGKHKEQPVKLTIERDGAEKVLTVIPNKEGLINIQRKLIHKYEPVKNPIEIFTKPYTFLQEKMILNFQAMGEIFTGKRSSKEVSGPVGIIKQGGMMIQVFGISEGLVITALISTLLAIMNILPIPMLDGGHLLFMGIELIKGNPLKKEFQERVIQFSFVVLIGLMCLIMWNDVNTHILGR